MEKLGDIIVPLIIFAVVIVNLILKISKAAKKQPPPPRPAWTPARPPKPARDDWADLLEALGKDQGDHDAATITELEEPPPSAPVRLPPVTTSAIKPPLLPATATATVSGHTDGGEKFTRVSDYESRPLDQIDERAFEVQRDLAEKFTASATNIAPVAAPTVSANRRAAHPVRARFHSRQSIREAVIMSEILAAPPALRN
ncbi:MAG: hypothetical protein LBK71_10505 [Verrucomicrobiales bacterium]|jgi:hypothetical protein|nr:hypothetical protein [Verrucomicrobiales bacterium]